LNNPTPSNNPDLWPREGIKFMVHQLERGEQGTLHYQGYVQFTEVKRRGAVRELCAAAHWEPRRGSAIQASHYCKKPELGCDCPHCVGAADAVRPQFIYESGVISAPAGEKLHSVAMTIKRRGFVLPFLKMASYCQGVHAQTSQK